MTAAIRLLANEATQYPDDKMLAILAKVGQIASAAAELEQLTGRSEGVAAEVASAAVSNAAVLEIDLETNRPIGLLLAEEHKEYAEPESEPEASDVDDIGTAESLAPVKNTSELLKALGLRSERYLTVLDQLISNPGKSYSPKDLRQLLDGGSDLGNRQAVTKLMNTIQASPYADSLRVSGKTSSRLYSWTSELVQASDDELEIEPEEVEMPSVELVDDHRPSPSVMPSRLPDHPVKPLDTRRYYETSRRLAIVDDEPKEITEAVPKEPAIEPDQEAELDRRLQELNIDYSEDGVKIKGVYLDVPPRVATLLADIASYKKGITFEELVKGIEYDKNDKYARINVGKQLSTDIKTIKTVLADFADELVFSDETHTKAQFGGGHNKQERLLTVLRPDEVRQQKKASEPEKVDEEDEEGAFLA